jgi:SpoVK/Ycf46/Vps4 family AAA+-type ATPase
MNETRAIDRFVQQARACLQAGYPILWIVSHEEQRVLDLLRKLAPGWKVRVWSCTRGVEPGATDRTPLEALALAGNAEIPLILVMLDVHSHLHDPMVVRALRDFAAVAGKAGKHAVIVSPVLELPVELEKDVAVLDLPLPDEADLCAAVQLAAKKKGIETYDELALVRAAGGLTWLEAQRAYRMAFQAPDDAEAVRRVVAEKRRVMRRSAALELVDTDVGLADVGGLEVLKSWLQTRVSAFGEEALAFGLPQPRGLMVCGIQGCGKSLVAKATARVFGLPLVRLDFAAVFASPSPELTVRQATSMAEAIAPVVLWVDEIEKGLGQGGGEGGSARVFGDFLIWMQEKKASVFVAATANEVEHLPPELVRRGRFDDVFFVDLPSAQERAEILSIHLQRRGRNPDDFPVEALTKGMDHFSGAEIEQLVISALFRAFAAKRDLLPEDVRLAGVELVPLATMYEERVQAMRTWAKSRARRASADRRTLDLFED